MTQPTRKILAVILLTLLLVLPFINWRLGAVLWMCAWLTYIFQNLFARNKWKFGEKDKEDDLEYEDEEDEEVEQDDGDMEGGEVEE